MSVIHAVVFVNTRRKVLWVKEKLLDKNITVYSLHGDMEQGDQDLMMKEFATSSSRTVLLTTDLVARRIDIHEPSLVINYDLPNNKENYIQRVRCAEPMSHSTLHTTEFGRKRVAINLVTSGDATIFKDIVDFYNTTIDALPMEVADII